MSALASKYCFCSTCSCVAVSTFRLFLWWSYHFLSQFWLFFVNAYYGAEGHVTLSLSAVMYADGRYWRDCSGFDVVMIHCIVTAASSVFLMRH